MNIFSERNCFSAFVVLTCLSSWRRDGQNVDVVAGQRSAEQPLAAVSSALLVVLDLGQVVLEIAESSNKSKCVSYAINSVYCYSLKFNIILLRLIRTFSVLLISIFFRQNMQNNVACFSITFTNIEVNS